MTMTVQTEKAVAVIGAGVIGLSWAALFAAKGHTVNVYDPRADLAEQLAAKLPVFIPQVPGIAEDVAVIMARVTPVAELAEAVKDALLVQESGPEKVEFKQNLWAEVEPLVAAETLLLSSSSGIIASEQGARMKAPQRIIIGHPFNPPHILPLVEISADPATPASLIALAMDFYRTLGKEPVQLHKQVPGFVANRLQMALVAEAIRLIDDGVVSIEELDKIVTASIGIRWASIGPMKAFHLGGGDGGLEYLLSHIGVGLATAIGQQDALTGERIQRIGAEAERAYPHAQFAHYQQARDRRQALIIADHQAHPDL